MAKNTCRRSRSSQPRSKPPASTVVTARAMPNMRRGAKKMSRVAGS